MVPDDLERPPEPRPGSRGEPRPSNGSGNGADLPPEQPPEPQASPARAPGEPQESVERLLANLLTEQIARADRAVQDRAQAILEAEHGRAALLAAQDAAQAAARAAAEALAEADKLREAEAARKARGRMARLRAAWRGT